MRSQLLIRILLFFCGSALIVEGEDFFWAESALADFEESSYSEAVEKIFQQFEAEQSQGLRVAAEEVVAIKVYTASGPGLATPHQLVLAVIQGLEKRGLTRDQMRIVDLRAASLRATGFLPPLSEGGDTFHGVPVRALDSGEFYEPEWFYESPLPPRQSPTSGRSFFPEELPEEVDGEDRKTFLPVNLLFDVRYWINLPMVTDHPHLGLSGALVNGTLWNASNTFRFFRSRSSGPLAVANMAAIPELRDTWRLNLVTLERVQYIGGPRFHSLYTFSEPLLLGSNDPVAMDARLIQLINQQRFNKGFRLIPENLPYLLYAEQLEIGKRRLEE